MSETAQDTGRKERWGHLELGARSACRVWRGAATAAWLLACAVGAQAQFNMVPPSAVQGEPAPSQAEDAVAYKRDAARHLYAAYPSRVYKGMLPPMMYAVMITEADVDASGQVRAVRVARPPAAATEVTPWVISLIRRASPFPAPARVADGVVTYREIWLVDKSGRFQVDTLTEGQR